MKAAKAAAKDVLKTLFQRAGLNVSRVPSYVFEPSPELRYRWLETLGIRTVLDVGAHTGETAERLHELFPQATVLSFEPLRDSFETMQRKLGDRPYQRCFNLALGAEPGEQEIHRSAFAQSSSLLKMSELHKQAYPFSAGSSRELIRTDTLDAVAARIPLEAEIFLKIDTQGFEKNVLLGGEQTLRRVRIIVVELSFSELYEGQPRFPEMYAFLTERGFEYRGSWDQFQNPKDGAPLQQDAIFMRMS